MILHENSPFQKFLENKKRLSANGTTACVAKPPVRIRKICLPYYGGMPSRLNRGKNLSAALLGSDFRIGLLATGLSPPPARFPLSQNATLSVNAFIGYNITFTL